MNGAIYYSPITEKITIISCSNLNFFIRTYPDGKVAITTINHGIINLLTGGYELIGYL